MCPPHTHAVCVHYCVHCENILSTLIVHYCVSGGKMGGFAYSWSRDCPFHCFIGSSCSQPGTVRYHTSSAHHDLVHVCPRMRSPRGDRQHENRKMCCRCARSVYFFLLKRRFSSVRVCCPKVVVSAGREGTTSIEMSRVAGVVC